MCLRFSLIVPFLDASPPMETPESDYVGTLLRDQTASHVLQTVIKHAPPYAFHHTWRTYFVEKLAKLAVHPIANFIVTEAIGRLDKDGLGDALSEVGKKLGKAIGWSHNSYKIRWPVLTSGRPKSEWSSACVHRPSVCSESTSRYRR